MTCVVVQTPGSGADVIFDSLFNFVLTYESFRFFVHLLLFPIFAPLGINLIHVIFVKYI